jgi:hypothetical protein
MSNTCENDYFNLYMTQLFQTLGQLSAALLTTTLAVPVYSFYTSYSRKTENTHYEIFEEENSNFVDSNNNTAENTCDEADIDADIDDDSSDLDDCSLQQ